MREAISVGNILVINGDHITNLLATDPRDYFENGEWKCNFYYKKQNDAEWIKGIGAMNSSTNRSNFIRFYAYPEDQVEICVDNVKVHNVGEDIHSAQMVISWKKKRKPSA